MFSASRVSEPFAYVGLLIKSLTTGTLLLAWGSTTGIKHLLYFVSIAACKDSVITDIVQQMKQICLYGEPSCSRQVISRIKTGIKTLYRRHEASIGNERDQISARIQHHAVHCSRLDANRSGEARDRGAAHILNDPINDFTH
jgi:hypothetical protein